MVSWLDRRRHIIEKIIATLKELEGLEYDESEFKNEICREYGCSWRTAAEYIRVAKAKRVLHANQTT